MTDYKLKRTFYKFVITNSTAPTTEAQKGFVDAYNSFDYADFDPEEITLNESKAKALGYIRWLQLSLVLSQFGVFYSNVLKLNGANYKTAPTSIEFVFGYNQKDSIICEVDSSRYVAGDDEIEKLRDGRVIFKGKKALKELVAKVLTSKYSLFVQYYDPTNTPIGRNPSGLPIGFMEEKMSADRLYPVASYQTALNSVTVTEIDELDLIEEEDSVDD